MQDVLNHFLSNSLNPGSLALDGKVHRFQTDRHDHKKSGWYCGFQNFFGSTGATFYVVRYGNYRTGEIFQYQSDLPQGSTPKDFRDMKESAEKARKAAEAERIKIQEEAAKEVQEKWNSITDEGTSPYFSAKGFSDNFTTRTSRIDLHRNTPFQDNTLKTYVPIYSPEGELVNLQKIQEDSGKFFYPGARIESCYHMIGDEKESDTIGIAEGYATARSCYEAVGKPIAVAFNSANLGKVAVALRKKYPDKAIVIYGDNDRFTKKPTGEAWNPGKEAAEAAAKSVLGTVVFPKFSNPESKGTDFNDLAIEEGIDRVREQIADVKKERHYIIALGHDKEDYFFLSNVNPQIQRIAAFNSTSLCRLQPLAYWEALFPAKNGISWVEAADNLQQQCHAKGVFNPENVRGTGCWLDRGAMIYHRGTSLVVANEERELQTYKSRFIYDYSQELPPLHPDPLTKEECQLLLKIAMSCRWKYRCSGQYLAGWIAIAGIAGALKWRPHVWVTGPSKSGKSYILEDITTHLLKDMATCVIGETTAAGLRQMIGCSTLPIIFDEIETDDAETSNRVRSIIQLARQASSDSSAVIAKGTVSGYSMQFRPRFAMMLGSIHVNLINEQDQNRFTILELDRPGDKAEEMRKFANLKNLVNQMGADYGLRLFSRMYRLSDAVLTTADMLLQAVAEKYDMRTGHQYGTLLAGLWMLTHDRAIEAHEAVEMVDRMELPGAMESSERKDETECWERILTKKVSIQMQDSHQDFAISEAIRFCRVKSVQDPDRNYIVNGLMRLGLKICEDGIIVAQDGHAELEAQVFRGTKWSRNWNHSLARIEGAYRHRSRLAGENKRFLLLPWNIIEKMEQGGTP